MPKRKCSLNSALQMKYPFLKKTTSDSDVMCGTCETNFSVASAERIFSLMNKVWTSEISHMTVNTLRAVLMTKFNFNKTCLEFHQVLKSNP